MGTDVEGLTEIHHSTGRYRGAVLATLASSTTWLNVAAARTPGFIGAVMLGPERTEQLAQAMVFVAVQRISPAPS